MTIRQLPVSPSRDRPAQFSQEMDAMLAALPDFVSDANALEQSLQLVATTGTSASTLTIGTGTKTLTTQPGKAWVTGAWVYVFCASAVTNLMVGQVTSYNVETGVLQINSQQVDGGGTFSSWVIGLSVPQVAWAKPGVNSDITALQALAQIPDVIEQRISGVESEVGVISVINMNSAASRVELSRFDEIHLYTGTTYTATLQTGFLQNAEYEISIHVASQNADASISIRPNSTTYANAFRRSVIHTGPSGVVSFNTPDFTEGAVYIDCFSGVPSQPGADFTLVARVRTTKPGLWKTIQVWGGDSRSVGIHNFMWNAGSTTVWSTLGAISLFDNPTTGCEYRISVRRVA